MLKLSIWICSMLNFEARQGDEIWLWWSREFNWEFGCVQGWNSKMKLRSWFCSSWKIERDEIWLWWSWKFKVESWISKLDRGMRSDCNEVESSTLKLRIWMCSRLEFWQRCWNWEVDSAQVERLKKKKFRLFRNKRKGHMGMEISIIQHL